MSISSPDDILKISQLARRINRVTTFDQEEAHREFQEVEDELKSTLEALDMLVQTLNEDIGIILPSEMQTVLLGCEQTLQELSFLFVRYQGIIRPDDGSGYSLRGTSNSFATENNKRKEWRREFGDLENLGRMLYTYTKRITSLLSKTTTRPYGQFTLSKHETNTSEYSQNDASVAAGPSHEAKDKQKSEDSLLPRPLEEGSVTRESSTLINIADTSEILSSSHLQYKLGSSAASNQTHVRSSSREEQDNSLREITSKDQGLDSMTGSNKEPLHVTVNRLATKLSNSQRHSSRVVLPMLDTSGQSSFSSSQISPFATTPTTENPLYRYNSNYSGRISPTIGRSIAASRHEAFETQLTRNGVILCEEKAVCVKYAEWNEPAQDWSMVQIASDCRVLIIRKADPIPKGASRFATTIWTLSTDESVRLEQKLDSDIDTVPYTAWGDTEKVSIRIDTQLFFHDLSLTTGTAQSVQTSWIDYVFCSEAGASNFQSALLEWSLILSVRTARTMRLHDGVAGFVSTQDQLCGLENIRLWKDLGTGEVIAMIHYRSQFQDGYMMFAVNSSSQPLQLRDDGSRSLKIKGLDILLENRRLSQRRSSSGTNRSAKAGAERRISSIRIDFTTEEERTIFYEKCKEIQKFPYN